MDLERLSPRACRHLAWGLTAIAAATVCYSLSRIPLQVTDSLIPMLTAQRTASVHDAIVQGSTTSNYLRPLRAAQIQAIFELADGRYFLFYKSFHVLLVVLCFGLFALLLDVNRPSRLAASSLALAVLIGMPTFRGAVWEAFPVNHSLEVVAFCLLTLVLCRSRGGWWADVGVSLSFVLASLTVESGLLVWVILVAAWIVRAPGASTRAVTIVTVLLGAYLVLRFGYLATGMPDVAERSSGFGLRQIDPGEIASRFGSRLWVFHAYNVASALLGTLLSEPRNGIWTVPAEWLQGRVAPGTAINVVSSLIMTAFILWFVAARVGAWIRREFEADDQIMAVALAVIAANAAFSFAYAKDEIMGPAGVFYALAAFVAVAGLLRRMAGAMPLAPMRATALGLVLALASAGWTMRAAGTHYYMHLMAFYDRNEWVDVDQWLEQQRETPTTADGEELVKTLRADALERFSVNPYLLSPRLDQWFR